MASSSDPGDERETALGSLLRALGRAPDVALAPASPARIGRYELIARLGAGGMGTVYRARDAEGVEVALKLLHPGAATPDALARLTREARVLAALSHPNIVALREVGEHDGAPFLALELLTGETLRQRLARGPLDVAAALASAADLLAALAAAHDRGVVHRDLKPENLFLTAAGPLKVLDFGLAKRLPAEAAPTSAATAAGAFLGTYGYMAPEQIRGEPVDARTDLFGFGAVLHEALAGRGAFAAPTAVETMHRILTEDAAPLDELVPAAPPALAELVARCLAREPAERPASAREVAAALAAIASGAGPTRARRPSAPAIRYARGGGVHIGYQVVGDGDPTIVVVPGFVSNIEQLWEDPDSARFFRRLAASARVVLFDKRGTGVSDRVVEPRTQTVEHRVDDVRAVLDDAGIDRAVLLGVSEGAPISVRFAVTYPERVAALALYGGYAAFRAHPGIDAIAAAVADRWGTGETIDWFAPSVAADPRKRRWWARWERLGASPGAAAVHLEVLREVDVAGVLGLVRVPTLVAHRAGDRVVPAAASRYLADRIPGARLLELAGDDHLIVVGDADRLGDEILAFARAAPRELASRACAAVVATPGAAPVRLRSIDDALAAAAAAPTAAIHADPHPSGAPRALAWAAAIAAFAAPGELLVSGDARGLLCDRGLTLADRGIHALLPGAPALRLFAIDRARGLQHPGA